MWRQILGARLGVYNPVQANKKKAGLKQGTFKQVKAQALQAMAKVAKANPTHQLHTPQESTLARLMREAISGVAGSRGSPFWTDKFLGG